MKVLLTGASGFIGKQWLSEHGSDHEIFTLGRSSPDGVKPENNIYCNMSDAGAIKAAMESGEFPEKIDAVIHLAVSRLHRTFPETANDLFEVNVASTAYLLDYAYKAGAQQFILGSSGSVYDGSKAGELIESRPLAPHRYFPASKLAAELLANQYREHFKVATIRFFTPYGPQQTDRLIPDLIDRVSSGRPVTLPLEGGGITLSALYIDDCIMIVNRALTQGWDTTVNAASEGVFSIEEIARLIGNILHKPPVFERVQMAKAYLLTPDLTHLNELLGGTELIKFEDGLKRVITSSNFSKL